MEAYNTELQDHAGHPPVPTWVKVTGLPYRCFKKFEFERIVDELSGSLLLELDPRSNNHLYFTTLRLKLGIADIKLIHLFRR
jgi:hypothetical protein